MFSIVRSLPTQRVSVLTALSFSRAARYHTSRLMYQEQKETTEKEPIKKEEIKKEEIKKEESSDISEIEKYKAQLAEKDAKIAEIDDKYKRSLAEAENVRRRARTEVQNERDFAIKGFAKSLISVADIFDLAHNSVAKEQLKENAELKNLFDGLTMIQTELYSVFKKHGLVRFEPKGEKFDPNSHEALFEVPADGTKEPGTVAMVQKLGYRLNGRVLRAATVGVVKSE